MRNVLPVLPYTYLTPPATERERQPLPGQPTRLASSLVAVRCYLTSLSRRGIIFVDDD